MSIDPGGGWRLIDRKKDNPQEGDQYWQGGNMWADRCQPLEPFMVTDVYRRRIDRVIPCESADYVLQKPTGDAVEHPSHYTVGPIECIDAIESALTPEQFIGYCRGNAIKYAWRADRKSNAVEDLQKARFYIDRELAKRGAK